MSGKSVKSDKYLNRRALLGASTAAGGALLATPALTQDRATIEWKMVTSWPKNLPGPGVTAQRIADKVSEMSAGRFRIRLYAAGELVPALGVFDAVSGGTAQMAHTASFFWQGENSRVRFFSLRYPSDCCHMNISPGLKEAAGRLSGMNSMHLSA